MRVPGEEPLHRGVGGVDVGRVARQGNPAERADPLAEQRPDIGRHEAGEGEGVLQPFLLRDLADVVAIVERRHARGPEADHRLDMRAHRRACRRLHARRVGLGLCAPFGDTPARRAITVQGVVGRGLVGHDVGAGAPRAHPGQKFGEDLGRVAEKAHGLRLALRAPAGDHGQRFIQRPGLGVEVAGADAEVDPRLVHLDGEAGGPGHHRRQRLRAAHAAEAAGQDPAPGRITAEMPVSAGREGLVGTLHDPLRADVDPGAGRHLAVHHQPLAVEFVEMVPGGPVRHQVRVGDQHARGVRVGAEDADRAARLHQQRLVTLEVAQGAADPVEVVPGAGSAADAAIDHQFVRVLGHVGVQVVHQHAQRGLGGPAFRRPLGAGGGQDGAGVVAGVCHGRAPVRGRGPGALPPDPRDTWAIRKG